MTNTNKIEGLYITPFNMAKKGYKGVLNKNQNIIKSFQKKNFKVDHLYFHGEKIMLNSQVLNSFKSGEFSFKLQQIFFFYKFILRNVDIKKYSFIIIRYPFATPYFIYFLKQIKKDNSQCTIILDVPTYPFEYELNTITKLVDGHFRRSFNKYVRYCITYCEQDVLFGIPCIKIQNGVNIEELPPIKKVPNSETFTMISVANVSFWHGLDRMILGLSDYYKNNLDTPLLKVYFRIVGDGPSIEDLKNLTEELNLTDYIHFSGHKTGQSLRDEYELANVASGSLGAFRKNVIADSAFKSREYCALGIPFIATINDHDFPHTFPFIKYFPNDESPIIIQDLINFYNTIVNEFPNYSQEMHEYALKNLTWDVKVNKIIKYLKP